MPPITNDWADYLKEEYKKPYYRKLYQKVMDEYHTKLIFPPADDIFNAFSFYSSKGCKSCDLRAGSISWRWTGTWIVIFCKTWSRSAPIIG